MTGVSEESQRTCNLKYDEYRREGLRSYTDCQSLLKIILHPMRPQLR
ncbi:hypothetical protein HX41_003788 [Salmonella enterica subsp. enterica]|nr:hypothetical protein [Salmonella enterica subsp. enterica]EEJ5116934.1 hypothetical protein [Salmonella enterica]